MQWDDSNIFITSQYGLMAGSLECGEGKLIYVSSSWNLCESESISWHLLISLPDSKYQPASATVASRILI